VGPRLLARMEEEGDGNLFRVTFPSINYSLAVRIFDRSPSDQRKGPPAVNAYHPNGRVQTITDAVGQTTSYAYNVAAKTNTCDESRWRSRHNCDRHIRPAAERDRPPWSHDNIHLRRNAQQADGGQPVLPDHHVHLRCGRLPRFAKGPARELLERIAQRGRDTIHRIFCGTPTIVCMDVLNGLRTTGRSTTFTPDLPPFLFLIVESEQEQPPVLKTNAKFVEDARKFGNEAGYKLFAGRKHFTMVRPLHQPGDAVFSIISEFIWQLDL
jgi:hypothetical protein